MDVLAGSRRAGSDPEARRGRLEDRVSCPRHRRVWKPVWSAFKPFSLPGEDTLGGVSVVFYCLLTFLVLAALILSTTLIELELLIIPDTLPRLTKISHFQSLYYPRYDIYLLWKPVLV
jgi:hypothetical protein